MTHLRLITGTVSTLLLEDISPECIVKGLKWELGDAFLHTCCMGSLNASKLGRVFIKNYSSRRIDCIK